MKEESHLEVLVIYGFVCLIIASGAAIGKQIYKSNNNVYGPRARRFLQSTDLLMYTAIWYAVSVSLTVFNKWFYTLWMGGFDLPLSSTACHMVVKYLLAHFLITNKKSPFQEDYLELTFQERIFLVAPIGLATATDIVLSNLSFLYITVTLYTILKSASLLWILFWGILFKLEKCSLTLSGVCICISVGLSLASYGETSVSLFGAILVLLAGCMGGLRWALSQRLMTLYDELKSSPLHLVAKIAPYSAISSVIAALIFDGNRIFHMIIHGWSTAEQDSNNGIDTNGGDGSDGSGTTGINVEDVVPHHHDGLKLFGGAIGFIVIGGLASFLLLLVEVKLLQLTSSLTVGVLGTCKEILQIILAVLVFNDKLTITNMSGLILCILGTLCYERVKSYQKKGENGGNFGSEEGISRDNQEYDPVRQADVELACFLNVEEEKEDYLDDDDDLSDGWDDMS